MSSSGRSVVALLLLSCTPAASLNDGFRQKLDTGCESYASCQALVEQAIERSKSCREGDPAYVSCAEARTDYKLAAALFEPYERSAAYAARLEQERREREELERRQAELRQQEADVQRRVEEQTRAEEARAAEQQAAQAPPPPLPTVSSSAPSTALSDAQVRKALIAESRASYSGNCPCPYDRDRAGRSCGKRSAYSRPGGQAPLCFDSDITPEMIADYRARSAR